MKKWMLNLAVVAIVSSAPAGAENWKDVTYGAGTIMRAGTGKHLVIPLPIEARYTQFGLVGVPTYVTQFLVRVEPASACKLAILNDGDIQATSVISTQQGIRPTSYTYSEKSRRRGRENWTNSFFHVNGGFGAPVQAIVVAFKRAGSQARQCDFEISVSSDEVVHGYAAGAAAAQAAPDAAPRAAKVRDTGEIKAQ